MAARVKWPWDVIRLAVAGGHMGLRAAAEKWGVPFGTISARSSREGWFKTGNANKLADVAPEIADVLADESRQAQKTAAILVGETLPELRERIRNAAGKVTAKALEHVHEQGAEYAVSKAKAIKDLVDAGGKATGFGEGENNPSVMFTLNFLKDVPGGGEEPMKAVRVLPEREEQDAAEQEPAGEDADQ